MIKSTLIEILKSSSKKELRDIRRWLESPAHNFREDVRLLFDYITGKLDAADDHFFEKEVAWHAVFPGESFDDDRMRQVMYFLLKSVESCLAWLEHSSDEVSVRLSLASLYRGRQLDKPFRSAMESAKKSLESSGLRDSNYFLEKFYLEQEQYFQMAGAKRGVDLNLNQVAEDLDLAYLTNKLRLACRMKSHEAVFKNANYDWAFIPPLLGLVDDKSLLHIPAIAVYYFGYKALDDRSNPTHFDALEKIIFSSVDLFPVGEQREIYLLAINYCIGRMNTGNREFARRAFELFRRGFENNAFLENGILSRFTFANAFAAALLCKEFDWIEKFIEKHENHLEEKHRHSVVQFHQARLLFEKGDFDKAQRLLLQFDYDDLLLNFVAKTMLLKIYYQSESLNAFESLLESMRTYLQRKDFLDANRKAVYKNFLSLCRKLMHLNPFSKVQVEKFREQVQNTNPLTEREWLLKQVEKK